MSTAAVSPGFICKLKDRKEVAEGTMAFRFEKPSGWTFKAGQYLDMTVLDPSEMDSEGNLRSFSIASAPHEVTLMVATRMRYGVQTRVEDNAVWDRSEDRRAVRGFDSSERFNASGRIPRWWIGITPFRSIVQWAAKDKLPHRIVLFYSNRRPEDAAFLAELQSLEGDNPNYKLVASMTEMEKSHQPWRDETVLIAQGMLGRHLKGAASPIYYIAGPPAMVKGLHEMLSKAGMIRHSRRRIRRLPTRA